MQTVGYEEWQLLSTAVVVTGCIVVVVRSVVVVETVVEVVVGAAADGDWVTDVTGRVVVAGDVLGAEAAVSRMICTSSAVRAPEVESSYAQPATASAAVTAPTESQFLILIFTPAESSLSHPDSALTFRVATMVSSPSAPDYRIRILASNSKEPQVPGQNHAL